MPPVSYHLNPDNIKHISFDSFENDFIFIVNGKSYRTNRFVADLISPKISNLHKIDGSISSFEITTGVNGDFNKILEYAKMKEIELETDELRYFLTIMRLLENYEEYVAHTPALNEEISFDNALWRIKLKKDILLDYDEELNFIATNFEEFVTNYHQDFLTLNVQLMEEIFNNENFKISDEDVLLDFIIDLYQASTDYTPLFGNVMFMLATSPYIEKFVKVFDFNLIDNNIWKQISVRLLSEVSKESRNAYKEANKELIKKRYQVYPIIEHLTEEHGGNIHLKGVIEIKASSSLFESKVENIVEDNDKYFVTEVSPNQWVQLDFKDKKVLLKGYVLKTFNHSPGGNHLRNWVLEGSDDGVNFTLLDKEVDCDKLNGRLYTSSFFAYQEKPQRYIRLREIGKDWNNDESLVLCHIELLGKIVN